MTDLFILIGLVVGAGLSVGAALVVARSARCTAWVASHAAAAQSRAEACIGLLGLAGLVGALTILFGAGLSLGLSTTSAALLLLVCAGGLSMGLRPHEDRAAWAQAKPEAPATPASKSAAA